MNTVIKTNEAENLHMFLKYILLQIPLLLYVSK